MKQEFNRTDGLFSLCGLNCGLCPMQIRGECSGCFNGSTCYQSCPIAPCSVRHGNVQYCYQCEEYPCRRYDGIDAYDSLISHRNQKRDLMKAKQVGTEAYLDEQREKKKILTRLLQDYDDGRRDVFYCLAVNMLEVLDLKEAMEAADIESINISLAKKAEMMTRRLYAAAEKKNVPLELRH